MIPFSVHVAGDPDGELTLVLAVSPGLAGVDPRVLVGPKAGENALRWIPLSECTFGRVYFDTPWSAAFTAPRAPSPTDASN